MITASDFGREYTGADSKIQAGTAADLGIFPAAAELQYGAKKRNHRMLTKKVQTLCNLMTIIPWNEEAASACAKLRVELENAGTPVGNMDMLIAASAIAENATLVTDNVEHFSKVASPKIENWC